MSTFNSRYGTSGTRLNDCSVCHEGSPPDLNWYGGDFFNEYLGTRNAGSAMANIEGRDSDEDGALNLAEIQARTFPGDPSDTPPTGAPVIGVSPTALAFGSVKRGSGGVLSTVISNSGNATLSVTSLSVGGGAEFGLTNAPAVPFNIAPGGAGVVNVRYVPANTGPDNGTLTVGSNDSARPSVVVALSANGVAPAITVNPPALDFGNLRQGETAGLTVTLGNSGDADCIVNGLTASGSADFTFGPSAPVAPFVIGPMSSVIVPISYTPSDVGADNGGILVASDDPANPSVTISLAGAGDPIPSGAQITVEPMAVEFGPVRVGQTRGLSVAIGNSGGTGCVVSDLGVSGGGFALGSGAPLPPFDVAPGATVVVPLAYAPSAEGNSIGNLSVGSTDPNRPAVNVGLTGTGVVPQVGAAPANVEFGIVTIGGAVSRPVAITNAGGASATITSLVLTASAEFDYAPSAPFPPFFIEAGGSTNIVLRYAPTDEGADAGVLDIGSDDPDSPGVAVSLRGAGQLPIPVPLVGVTPSSLGFGDVRAGQSGAMKVTISNAGGAVANIGAPGVIGSSEFSVPGSAFALAAGESRELTVTYAPTAEGGDLGTLVLTSDDPANPAIEVALSGRGTQPALALEPATISFGSVVVNGSVTRVVSIVNRGTAEATVSAIALSGSAEFALGAGAPAVPLVVVAGGSVDVPVGYRPGDTGTDGGALEIASDDPMSPNHTATLAGSGIPNDQAVDLDVTEFRVTEQFEIGISKAIEISLRIVNGGSVSGSRTATVIGLMNGAEVYRVSQGVAAGTKKKKKTSDVSFPKYVPTEAGQIEWSAIIEDDDPDSDVATATTRVGLPVLDLDISEFKVSDRHEIGTSKSISFGLVVVNRSSLGGSRAIAVVGVQGGAEVYRATVSVSPKSRGGSTKVSLKSYSPSSPGMIQWTATLEDDDPDPDVATAATSVTVPLVDLDISEFKVTEKYAMGPSQNKPVQIQVKVSSRNKVQATRPATVVGVQGGIEVYRATLEVRANGGKNGTLFPSYVPLAAGQILWTVGIEDDDPDADVRTARTLVTAPPRQDDDEDDDRED